MVQESKSVALVRSNSSYRRLKLKLGAQKWVTLAHFRTAKLRGTSHLPYVAAVADFANAAVSVRNRCHARIGCHKDSSAHGASRRLDHHLSVHANCAGSGLSGCISGKL